MTTLLFWNTITNLISYMFFYNNTNCIFLCANFPIFFRWRWRQRNGECRRLWSDTGGTIGDAARFGSSRLSRLLPSPDPTCFPGLRLFVLNIKWFFLFHWFVVTSLFIFFASHQCDNGHIACSSCCLKLRNKCPACT